MSKRAFAGGAWRGGAFRAGAWAGGRLLPVRAPRLYWSGDTRPALAWSASVAVITDLSGYAGEDWLPTFTAKVPPQGIAGWTIVWTLRNPYTGAVLATRTTAGGDVVLTDPVNGTFTVSIRASDLQIPAGMPSPALLDWDASRVDVGFNTVLARGEWTLANR